MKKTILILSIMALIFTSCKRDEILNEGDKWYNGHAAVDLGLPSGLYWATCNIGASVPEERGSYYRWGVTSEGYGTSQNTENLNLSGISGDAQYDAASANWGGLWRMPTKYEMQELLNLCSWEETTYNGIEAYQVVGPNGNSIFIPYAEGYRTYWTSSPCKEYGLYDAYGLTLYPYNDISIHDEYRSNCYYVRPVFGGNKVVSFDAVSRDIEYRDITSTTARFGIIVMQDEDGTITSYGACWSTDARPTIDDEHYTFYEYNEYDGNDDYSECFRDVYLENLMPNTKYYIRAFAVSGDNVVYGEVKNFTTLPVESGQEGGHSYIDLGLPSGVKWAMCNYGSYSGNPWDYGDYVSWGGEYNYDYDWNPNNCPTYGIEMGDISGSQYDYVNKSWGGQWRMPTLYEMQELRDYCTWEWVSSDYRLAYKITGPNGNSIILPMYGYYEGNQYYEDYDNQQGALIGPGYYWTSTPYDDGSNNNAYCLEFGSEYVQIIPNLRYYGLNIRPVIGYNEALYPTVRMKDVTDITTNSAKCSASIDYSGTVQIYERGFVWSMNYASPTLENYDNCVYADYYENYYSCEIYNLNSNTTYYVRAFVYTSMGYVYSDVLSFRTLDEVKELPVVTTDAVTGIEAVSAICGGEVTDDGGGTVTERGVCWSTLQNPTINDNKTTDGSGIGNFTTTLNNLVPQTTYYVRAYATNEAGTAYGEEISFTTLDADNFDETISGTKNGYDYVDLGLPSGLKWANYNIGASNYKEHGNPYAWGETTTKTEYTASNSVTYRQKVSEFSGNAQYDAATANWGGEWRMPTKAEFEELLNECTWQWLTLQYDDGNYTNGYKVTGPNGNRIFLPETLIYEDNGMAGAGGSYWSSTPPHTDDEQAFYLCLKFGYSAADVYCSSGIPRYCGLTIRPVF